MIRSVTLRTNGALPQFYNSFIQLDLVACDENSGSSLAAWQQGQRVCLCCQAAKAIFILVCSKHGRLVIRLFE